jgi:hypothetical protein
MIKLSRISNRKAKVLINPTRKEIKEISEINDPVNNVRAVNFILDITNKKFYVFSPNKSHEEIAEGIPTLKRTVTGSLVRMEGDKEWIVECLSGFEQNDKVIKQLIKKVYLNEAFLSSMKTNEGIYVEIYVNPSPKELDDASVLYSFAGVDQKLIRFIYDVQAKRFYVFSPDVFHEYVMRKLGHERSKGSVDDLYSGNFPHGAATKSKNGGVWGKWKIENLKGIREGNFDPSSTTKKEKTKQTINSFLNESFHSGYKSSIDRSYGEIYVNPTISEINKIETASPPEYTGLEYHSVNFIYDEDKDKLYVFPWNEWHEFVMKKVGLETRYEDTPTGQLYRKGTGEWHVANIKLKSEEEKKRVKQKVEEKLGIKPKIVKEEFAFSIKDFDTNFPIYKISQEKDEIDLMKASKNINHIRFIADAQTKGFYVFSGEIPHAVVAQKIGVNIYEPKVPVIAGIIEEKNGYWRVTDSFNVFTEMEEHNNTFLKKVFASDWSFVQKFVNIKSFLEDAKKQWIEGAS